MKMLKYLNTISKIKVKDSIVLSLVCGLMGTIIMDLSNFFLWRTKKTELLYGHLAGSMIMRAFRTNRTKNFLLGQFFHLFTGAALGIPMYSILKNTGKDHHLLKGAFMGGLSWGLLYNFGQRARLYTTRANLTKSHYASIFHNLLYGITTAELMVRFADESLFKEQSLQQNRTSTEVKAKTSTFIIGKNDPMEEPLPLH